MRRRSGLYNGTRLSASLAAKTTWFILAVVVGTLYSKGADPAAKDLISKGLRAVKPI